MKDSTRYLGPRGWAVLVLAGGAALSVPFLRGPGKALKNTPPSGDSQTEVDFSNKAWPDLREESLTPSKEVASNLSEQDWAELARLQRSSGATPRRVTGDLPSTRGTPTLPSWADQGPRVDQLVNDSIRSEPLPAAAPEGSAALEPLRPWMGHGMQRTPDPSVAPLGSDFALATPDPSTRWTTIQSDAFRGAAESIVGTEADRKNQDAPQGWPDARRPSAQVAWDASRTLGSEPPAARPNVNWPTPGRLDRSLGQSQPAGHSQANPASRPIALPEPLADLSWPPSGALGAPLPVAPLAQPSAPLVGSQSGRPAPVPPSPALAPGQPTPALQRTKHFIQQPSKRA